MTQITSSSPEVHPPVAYRIQEPDVIHQLFDREVVVVDLRNGSYYSLSEVGGVAWLAFGSGGATTEEVSRRIAESHEVSLARVRDDVAAFVEQLLGHDLLVLCPAPAADQPGAGPTSDAVPASPYAPPTLKLYNDLQDLFLLDPVHEVNPAMGWPQVAEEIPEGNRGDEVRAATAGDILVTEVADGVVFVNRDRGLYCVGDSSAAELWRQLSSGPVKIKEGPVLATLREAGLVEPAAENGPTALPGCSAGLVLHRDLETTMRPWMAGSLPPRRPATAQAAQILERLDRGFEDAASSRGGSESRWYEIGGRSICLRVIPGEETNRLLPAIAHLSVAPPDGGTADLTVSALSGRRGLGFPLLDNLLNRLADYWQSACGPRGEVLELHAEEVSAIYNAGPNVLTVVDFATNRGWLLKLDDAPFPYWEVGSPLRFLWHEWFARQGLQYVHAAAVGNASGGVLLVGQGGSGKSTTALLCAAAGMSYAGDDYCLVDPSLRVAHSLYNTGKLLSPDDYARLPQLQGLSANPDGFERGGGEKAVYFLSDIWPDCVVKNLPLRAILLPKITGAADTSVEPCNAREALAALLPSTVGQLPAAGSGDGQRMAALVRQLPAYRLHLGREIGQIPAAIQALLAG